MTVAIRLDKIEKDISEVFSILRAHGEKIARIDGIVSQWELK